MKKKVKIFLLVLVVAIMVTGLRLINPSINSFKTKIAVKSSDISSYLKRSINTFGLETLKTEAYNSKFKNIMISPLSIFTALNITTLGAGGDTREQMKKVMKIGEFSEAERNESMNTLINYIRNTAKNNNAGSTEIYNSLWINKGIDVKDSFLRDAKVFYDSDVFNRDFGNNNTIKEMNNWIFDKSKGLIKNPIGVLDRNTMVSIFNVVHFLGKWSKAFEKANTKQEFFTTSSGQRVMVSMMNDERKVKFYEDKKVKVGILDFDNGSMMIMLPTGDVNSFLNKLNTDDIDKYSDNATLNETQIKMPRLDINYKTTLNDSLIKLGMTLPFDNNKANFNNLETGTNPLFINTVIHQCVLKLDEEKAEAVGFTGVMLTTQAVKIIDKVKKFYVDKPFVFLIRNDDNILFAGKIEKP
jgi:serpin B